MVIELFKPPKSIKVKTIPNISGRVIAIGDVHGCLDELQLLVDKVNPTKEDLLVLLGDLVDRGPDSEGVIQYLVQLQKELLLYSVMGNHDEKLVRYHYHKLLQLQNSSYKIPMRHNATYDQMSESSLEFLANAPHAIFIPNEGTDRTYPICLVHAGLGPGVFNQAPNAFVRNRYFTRNIKDNRMTPVKSIQIDDVWYVPEGSYPWSYYWDGRWTV